MWGWINDNAAAISAVASIATLMIWVIYLQMLFSGFREGRRAKILINRGGSPTLNGHCLVANMSAKAIFIDAVLLDFSVNDEAGRRHFSYSLSNLTFEDDNASDPRAKLFQGPLAAAEHLDLGTFRTLIERMSPPDFDRFETIESIRITIVATYTSEDRPVAAERVFDIIGERDELVVSPRSYAATQLRSHRQRRRIERSRRDLHQSERDGRDRSASVDARHSIS
ncbi:hypothetical protein [Martelella soudanensis]|uniref:hypothetical protein n=1 Tax=unclassified Martelella TaxID=2629616 RepID=UPI0015DFAE82|nr:MULTISPECIES: hypothetical protein [unclassified Martelella]